MFYGVSIKEIKKAVQIFRIIVFSGKFVGYVSWRFI